MKYLTWSHTRRGGHRHGHPPRLTFSLGIGPENWFQWTRLPSTTLVYFGRSWVQFFDAKHTWLPQGWKVKLEDRLVSGAGGYFGLCWLGVGFNVGRLNG
jgi:hypothetical protein